MHIKEPFGQLMQEQMCISLCKCVHPNFFFLMYYICIKGIKNTIPKIYLTVERVTSCIRQKQS